jgi:hypothetical protein
MTMTKSRFIISTLSILVVILAASSFAAAQATRTWVSGVGDDANPCSRTAPCKTFAGAISKTAIGGEIDALDPGGFGAVTITKSITIDGCCMASILASFTTAINVSIASGNANDPERRVTIRHLSINGTGGGSGSPGQRTGLKGINITAANAVHVENCYIQHFTQEGINLNVTNEAAGAALFVKDTNIQNCNVGINSAAGTGFAVANLNNVRIEKMVTNGLVIGTHGHAHVRQSYIAFCPTDGVSMAASVTDGSVNLESTFIASNGTGVRNGGTGSVIDLSNSSILQNSTGIASSSGAAGGGVNSHGNNMISGNTSPGTTPNGVGQQ